MNRRNILKGSLAFFSAWFFHPSQAGVVCQAPLNLPVRRLNSQQAQPLCELTSGKVCLFVNVASHCGFTYQYEALEKLYQTYKDRGLIIIGFPSDDFFQEKDKEADIAQFCQLNYGVSFPMMEKISVRGDGAHPIFSWLQQRTDTRVKWNFFKFLVNKDAQPVAAFSSMTEPFDHKLIAQLESLL